jgi:hypothetical protein
MSIMKSMAAVGVAAGLALVAAACSDPVAPAAPTPAPAAITETFTQSLAIQGLNTLFFNVQQLGGLTVTLTSVDPAAPTGGIGLGLGTANAGACSVLTRVSAAQPAAAPQLSGTATLPNSTYCVTVYDTGTLTEPVTFTVVVRHS